MTTKQETVIQKLETAYQDYLDDLETMPVQDIISQSEQTIFYANLLYYLREKQLSDKELAVLNQNDSLNKIYQSYLKNNYDTLDILTNYGRTVYQYIKEQKHSEM